MAFPFRVNFDDYSFSYSTYTFNPSNIVISGACFYTVAHGGNTDFDAIALVNSPSGQSGKSLLVKHDGDYDCADAAGNCAAIGQAANLKHRSEVLYQHDAFTRTDVVYWIGMSIYVPADTPTYNNDFICAQSVGGAEGPEWKLYLDAGATFKFKNRYGSVSERTLGTISASPGNWHHFVVEWKRSTSGSGILGVQMAIGSGAYSRIGSRLTNVTTALNSVNNPRLKNGVYWGNNQTDSDRPGIMYEMYFKNISIDTGTDKFDSVDPQGTVQATPPVSAPTGTTVVTGFTGSNGDWFAGSGTEIRTYGENQTGGSGTVSYAGLTFLTTTEDSLLDLYHQVTNSSNMSDTVQWKLRGTVSGVVASGSYPQNSNSSDFYLLGLYIPIPADTWELRIYNSGSTAYVAADQLAYKNTALSAPSSTIGIADGYSATSSVGSSTAPSIAIPSGLPSGTVCLVVIHSQASRTVTLDGNLEAYCTQLKTATDQDRTHVAAIYRINGTTDPSTLGATLSSSAVWKVVLVPLKNINLTDTFDTPHEANHTDTADGTQHLLGSASAAPVCPAYTPNTLGDAIVQISFVRDDGSQSITDVTSSNGTATELFKDLDTTTGTANRIHCYGTYDVVSTLDPYSAGTHTYTGTITTAPDWMTLTFAFKPASATSTVADPPAFIPQAQWEVPIASVYKNSETISYDVISLGGFTGGVAPFTYSAYYITGCDVQVSGTNVNFTPVTAFDGDAKYVYVVTDSNGDSTSITITVPVINRAPVAVGQTVSITAGTTQTYNLRTRGFGTDADGDSLTFDFETGFDTSGNLTAAMEADGYNITVDATGESLTVTETGIKLFAFDGSNSNSQSETSAILAIEVVAVASAAIPTLSAFSMTVGENSEGNTVPWTTYATSPDGLPLSPLTVNGDSVAANGEYSVTAHGIVYNDSGVLLYTPDVGYNGTDSIVGLVITNGTNNSTPAVAGTVTVLPTDSITADRTQVADSNARNTVTTTGNMVTDFGLSITETLPTYTVLSLTEGSVVFDGDDYTWSHPNNSAFREARMVIRATTGAEYVDCEVIEVMAGSAPNVRGVKRIVGRRLGS